MPLNPKGPERSCPPAPCHIEEAAKDKPHPGQTKRRGIHQADLDRYRVGSPQGGQEKCQGGGPKVEFFSGARHLVKRLERRGSALASLKVSLGRTVSLVYEVAGARPFTKRHGPAQELSGRLDIFLSHTSQD